MADKKYPFPLHQLSSHLQRLKGDSKTQGYFHLLVGERPRTACVALRPVGSRKFGSNFVKGFRMTSPKELRFLYWGFGTKDQTERSCEVNHTSRVWLKTVSANDILVRLCALLLRMTEISLFKDE